MADSDFTGFIVHAYSRTMGGRTLLYFIGRLQDGKTFAVAENRYKPCFYVRESELSRAEKLPEFNNSGRQNTGKRTMDGEPCFKVCFSTQKKSQQAADVLKASGLRTYEADLRLTDNYRLERQIHGPVRIQGNPEQGRRVDFVFRNPELEPSNWQPQLTRLSLDIETDPFSFKVLAIGLSFLDPFKKLAYNTVLFVGSELNQTGIECIERFIECFADERSLLIAFRERINELDPDIITGWNVVDFDFRILTQRFKQHGIPLDLGRSKDPAAFMTQDRGRNSRMIIPGRQIWDGIRLVRASPDRFDDYSLETVAGSVLGYGKEIHIAEGEKRLEAIIRLYRDSPVDFCRYCLRDAQLVHEIFDSTGLFELTLSRCLLIGVAPDRAWTSILAFEHLYIEAMHTHSIVAPSMGVDTLALEGAQGGIILTPQPGVYEQVMVFDFQSLYPSIIRTFNIDPVSLIPRADAELMSEEESKRLIRAPNGALFSREPAILPELLNRFFKSRKKARQNGDNVASYVYKIIMNSFYGVLGARRCRFAGSDLAGAITSFGQHIVTWCKELLEEKGCKVIYGDTDSLFVTAEREPDAICKLINNRLSEYLEKTYCVSSQLILEFEKLYVRFFLPPLRADSLKRDGQFQKGRAKGYAGLIGSDEAIDILSRIEIKGMEAIRRDWTDLAHEFQIGMLKLLFQHKSLKDFQEFIKYTVKELIQGRLDSKLIYRKALRKPFSDYTRSRPPHVKAAALLDTEDRRGLIRYLITRDGPQPQGKITSDIDYDHYIEKQLKPIAATFTEAISTDMEELFGSGRQLSLF